VKNPLTHQDLEAFLGVESYAILHRNILGLAKTIKDAYSDHFYQHNSKFHTTNFLIYGMDVAPDSTLKCKIMEVNKGPDLSYKDERDKAVKLHMVHEALGLAGLFGATWKSKGSFIHVV
jgi:hypothetical protein